MAVSVVGFDIGTLTSYVVVARQGGIETVANEYSDRSNPSFVSFNDKMRSIGHEAKQQQVTNIPNTLYNFTRFLGKQFSDSLVQEEIKRVSYKVVQLADDRIGFEVNYLNETNIFTPEQVLAMQLTKMKEVAEMNLNNKVVDVVINVPDCYVDSERRAVLDAAQIANLNCIRIINDSTASAVAYGIYSQELPEPDQKPKNVVFIDVGYTSLKANIVAFNKGKMKVLANTSAFVGGRDFDFVIYNYMKKEIFDKYKLEVVDGKKPSIRLLQECEKLKKLMSANSTEIPMNIECFMNDVDIGTRMKRETFENISADLFKTIQTTLMNMLSEAKINVNDIHSVEIVGGSTRIAAIKRLISEIFNKEGRTSLNADEAVARGCALQCAIISPAFKVKDFSIQDACPFSISLSYSDDDKQECLEVYPKWHSFPASKQLTFYRTNDFQLMSHYTQPEFIPVGTKNIGLFNVMGVKTKPNGEASKVKVKVRVNANGIFTVSQAQLVENVEKQVEVEVEEPVAEKDKQNETTSEPMEVEQPVNGPGETNGELSGGGEQKKSNETGEGNVEKTSNKVKKMVTKNVTNHIDLPLKADILQYQTQKINEFNEKENQMIMQVKLEKERESAKNAVEEYVYEMRSKLSGDFEPFCTESDKDVFLAELTKAENWLYEEGEDEIKQKYVDKLNHLKSMGNPVVARAREAYMRPQAMDEFGRIAVGIQKVIQSAEDKEEQYNHLTEAEIVTLKNTLEENQKWYTQEMSKQQTRKNYEDPVLSVADIMSHKEKMEKIALPIVNKPKPKVTPPEENKADETMKESKDENQQNSTSGEPQNTSNEQKDLNNKPDDMDLD